MKAFLRPHRFRHPYPVRFYTTKTQSVHRRSNLAVTGLAEGELAATVQE